MITSELNDQEIIQCDRYGNCLGRFKSISEAAQELGIFETNIFEALNDNRNKNTAGGFRFARAENKILAEK